MSRSEVGPAVRVAGGRRGLGEAIPVAAYAHSRGCWSASMSMTDVVATPPGVREGAMLPQSLLRSAGASSEWRQLMP